MLFVYQPVIYPDSGTYITMASQMVAFDFRGYNGWRTPTYPLILILGGQNHKVVWLIQSLLGIFTSLILFWICFAYTANAFWSLLAGALHSLALNQLFFEANILSETVSTFLIVSSVACLLYAFRRNGPILIVVLAGFLAGLAALSRPLYVYLGPLFFLLVLLFERDSRRMAVSLLVAFLLPVLGWAAFNKATIDYFGLSTQAGVNLSNHSGRFMEKASDKHAMIRDIYLKHREIKIAETGRHQQTFWYARDELLQKTGFDDATLSRELTKLSLELFAQNPILYLTGVVQSWARYWAAPLYVVPEKFTLSGAAAMVETLWPIERFLIVLMNFVALAACGWVIVRTVSGRLKGAIGLPAPLIIACVILAASILQALVEFGENPRYGIPTQSIGLTLFLLAAWDLRLYIKRKPAVASG